MPFRQQAPVPVFPRPPERYDSEEEAQYRLSVEQGIQDLIGYLTESNTGTPATLAAGDINNYSIGAVVDFLRITADAGAGSALTGIADGRSNRRLVVVSLTAGPLLLEHEDTASTASNRIITATGSAITLVANDMAELIYDDTSARWRVMGTAV